VHFANKMGKTQLR